jgi:hypothetical protein
MGCLLLWDLTFSVGSVGIGINISVSGTRSAQDIVSCFENNTALNVKRSFVQHLFPDTGGSVASN